MYNYTNKEKRPLTRKEEIKLFKEKHNIKEVLLKKYIKMITKIADKINKSNNYAKDTQDLIQEGVIALYEASESYDYQKGTRFSTHSYYKIKCRIQRYISKNSKDVITYRNKERLMGYYDAKEYLYKEKDRKPTDEELSDFLNVKKETINNYKLKEVVSLDEERGENSDTTLLNLLENNSYNPEIEYEKKELRNKLEKALKSLSDREKYVIKYRTGFNKKRKIKTFRELGKDLDLTRQMASTIEKRSIKKLKKLLKKDD